MLNLTEEERLLFLIETIPNALQKYKSNQEGTFIKDNAIRQTIYPYMIIDPAGEQRQQIAGYLNASFISMQGIFPDDISKAVEADNEEPQLILLNQESNILLGEVLKEDCNAVLFLYSALTLKALAKQLKPQLHITVKETEQAGFMRYWDARVFPTLAKILNTSERKQAFMGNIYTVGLLDEEDLENFNLYYVHNAEVEEKIVPRLFHTAIDPTQTLKPLDYTRLDYLEFTSTMLYTQEDAQAFKENKTQKQIRQMTRMLLTHPIAQEKDVTFDELIKDVERASKYADEIYNLNDIDSNYQFVLASYILGGGLEKEAGLESLLKDKEQSNTIKRVKIQAYLKQHIGE
jgi:hypothetical protein